MKVFKQTMLFFFQSKILRGILESIKGLRGLGRKDYKTIYKF
jgi:hypothetical protein